VGLPTFGQQAASADAPPVCICVPTYNAAATIQETLDSLLQQTYQNLVVHVVDNASADATLAIVEQIDDPRIVIHRRESTVVAEANFTRCIELASGRYTAIFHSDDVYERDIVEKQVVYLDTHPGVSATFTQATLIDEQGVPFGSTGGYPKDVLHDRQITVGELVKSMLKHHNYLVCPSVMVRTEIYRDHIRTWGNEEFASASDVDIWIRLAEAAPIVVLAEKLMRYRISSTQFSHRNRNRTKRPDFFTVMDYHLRRPEIRALLVPADLRHYAWLQRHDCVARAMNLFGAGQASEAKDLLKGLLGRDMIRAAFATRRGFVTLAGYALLKLLLPFGQSTRCMAWIRSAKRISWR